MSMPLALPSSSSLKESIKKVSDNAWNLGVEKKRSLLWNSVNTHILFFTDLSRPVAVGSTSVVTAPERLLLIWKNLWLRDCGSILAIPACIIREVYEKTH